MSSDSGHRRYDGPTFRALRAQHGLGDGRGLTRIIGTASPRVGGEIFPLSRGHIRQWECGQRNISAPYAARLAKALSKLTGHEIRPADFEVVGPVAA